MQELQDLQASSAVIAPPIEVQSQVTDPLQPLKAQRRWVVYRSVEDKAPLQPSGYPAKSDTSATWSTYDDCMSAVATGKFHGVGFVLTNSGYVGVDFDDVRDEDGIIDPVALSVAKSLDSYSEVSPSGTGFHTLLHAPSFSGGKKKPHIEIYGGDSSKYFTVTGQHINGTPNVVNGRESEIAAVFSTLDAINTQITSSVKAQKKSLVSKVDSNKLADLMGGNWEPHYDGVSEAVLGLLCLLAEKTKCDPEAMDEEFRKSGLYADHSPEHANWVEKWERRGKEEIATAISSTSPTLRVRMTPLDWAHSPDPPSPSKQPSILSLHRLTASQTVGSLGVIRVLLLGVRVLQRLQRCLTSLRSNVRAYLFTATRLTGFRSSSVWLTGESLRMSGHFPA